ncbi:hypothetical protein GGR57DRAFT_448738 [Xylariaceae sp. FL1272]|nr:hypothetical protein GGR57DRAFT_448738 [Xylariaceae sp. FL1272]
MEQSSIALVFDGQSFDSLKEATAWIANIPDPRERFRAQEKIARQAFQQVSQDADCFEQYMAYLESDQVAYRSVLESYRAFEKTFEDELGFARDVRRLRDRRQESIRCIQHRWSNEPQALAWIEFLTLRSSHRYSKQFFDKLRTLARSVKSWEIAQQRINAAVKLRLQCRKRGIRFVKDITTGDLFSAKNGKFQKILLSKTMPPDDDWLRKQDMHIDEFGLLASDTRVMLPPLDSSNVGGIAVYHRLNPSSSMFGETLTADSDSSADSKIDPNLSDSEETSVFVAETPPTDVDVTMATAEWANQFKRCGCSVDVPEEFIDKISQVSESPLREKLDMLDVLLGFKLPCLSHVRRFAWGLGLDVVRVEQEEMKDRLKEVAERRDLLLAIENESSSLRLFRKEELFAILYEDED